MDIENKDQLYEAGALPQQKDDDLSEDDFVDTPQSANMKVAAADPSTDYYDDSEDSETVQTLQRTDDLSDDDFADTQNQEFGIAFDGNGISPVDDLTSEDVDLFRLRMVEASRTQDELNRERELRIERERLNAARLQMLRKAKARGQVMWGAVISTREKKDETGRLRDDEVNSEIVANVAIQDNDSDAPFIVSVPFSEFFDASPLRQDTIDLTTATGIRNYINRQRSLMNNLIGQQIPFIVKEIFYREGSAKEIKDVLGSRRAALQIIRKRAFSPYGTAKTGNNVTGRIIYVRVHNIILNVCGCDITVPQYALTNRFIAGDDLRNYYHPGDTLDVRITNAEIKPDGTPSLTIDPIACELEKARARIVASLSDPNRADILKVNDTSTAIITRIYTRNDNTGHVSIYAWADLVNLPIHITGANTNDFGTPMVPGMRISIQAKGYTKNGYTNAVVTRIIGMVDYSSPY